MYNAGHDRSQESMFPTNPTLPLTNLLNILNVIKKRLAALLAIRITVPLTPAFFVTLIATYIIFGLIGHDPWKANDAVSFGVVYQMLKNENWLIPMLTNEPFLEKLPLYYWVAAFFAKLFSPLLPLHDAARLASGFFTALILLFTALAAREWYGKNQGQAAALILIGCPGFLAHAHNMTSDIAGLTGITALLYGLTLFKRHPKIAGFISGCGLGCYFLAQGLLLLPALLLLALVVPLSLKSDLNYSRAWYFVFFLLSCLPWVLIWPFALYSHSPDIFMQWWNINIATIKSNIRFEFSYYFKTLLWSSWPAWPLALWSLWQQKNKLLIAPLLIPFVSFLLLLLLTVTLNRETKELNALPLLLPLSILASAQISQLRRGAANALDWFGMMSFTLFGLFIWVCWFALLTGSPEKIALRLSKLEPGYIHEIAWVPLILAIVLSVLWIVILLRAQRSPYRSIIHWAAGIAFIWGLLMTLLLPWIDYGKSYRSMVLSLKESLPKKYRCINSLNLGEPQRASLDYFADIITRRIETGSSLSCKLLLVQGSANNENGKPGAGWIRIWQGNRPGDKSERYRLYEKK